MLQALVCPGIRLTIGLTLTFYCTMQNFNVDQCGAVHITMGDGGNIEGLCKLCTNSCFLCARPVYQS